MEINLYQKNRWNEIYLNLLKFGTIEKSISALDYKTIENSGNRKIILKMLLN
jgi:hypothetical protein